MTKDNEQAKSLWERQKQWKNLTNPLTHDPEIHSQINNLLIISYWNFRKNKGIPKGTYEPEINFRGFGGFEDFPEKTKMGHCKLNTNIDWEWKVINGKEVEGSETKIYEATMSIFLSQKYLLNKLGMNEFISDYIETERSINWSTLPIGFEELTNTIAHELAHAFQNTINLKEEGEKSQCESSGDRDENGNLLYPELATEHTVLTEEIKQMIKSSAEYQGFKEFWKEGKIATKKNQSQGADFNSQSLSDKVKDTTNEASDASAQGVKKTGEGLEKAGKSLEGAADNKQWPGWVLPVGIGLGILLLIVIITSVFKKKKQS